MLPHRDLNPRAKQPYSWRSQHSYHQVKVGVKGLYTYLREERDSGRGEDQGQPGTFQQRQRGWGGRARSGHTRGYDTQGLVGIRDPHCDDIFLKIRERLGTAQSLVMYLKQE